MGKLFVSDVVPPDVVKSIKEKIIGFAGISVLPINGLHWEEILYTSFIDNGYEAEWNVGSHAPGADIIVGCYKISNKSTKATKTKIYISSHRTTKHKRIYDKIEFIDEEANNFTHYCLMVRDGLEDIINYKVYLFPSDLFAAQDFVWTPNSTGWYTNRVNGIKLSINKKTSDQLWISIDRKRLESMGANILEVSVNKKDLGKTHKIVRR